MDVNEKLEKELEENFSLYKYLELVGYSTEKIEQIKNSKRAEYIEFHTRPHEILIVKVPELEHDEFLDEIIRDYNVKATPVEVDPFTHYSPFALMAARKWKKYYNTSLWEDIDQEALISLLAAIESYNPTTERQTIERYIAVVVKNNLLDFLYRQKDLIGVSVRMRSLDAKIKSASNSGLSHEQIREKFKVSEERILDALSRPEVVSLDELPFLNKLVSPDPAPEWLDPDSDLVAALKTLKSPEYSVLCLYHGLWCQVPVPVGWQVGGKFETKDPTFLMVGVTLGVPTPTVKKRYYSALKKLAEYFGYEV